MCMISRRMAWDGQVTNLLPPTQADNLRAPLPGDRGAHGSFAREARPFSSELWIRTHRGTVALGAAVLIVLGVTGVTAARRLISAFG